MLGDDYYMGLALAEARAAADEGEIPVGAIVTGGGRVLGRGHNQTERLRDVTAHAEMLAISAAAQTLGGKYLGDCTLYVTVEPCPMCAGAIGWSQIGRIVIGAPDPKRGYSTILRPGCTPFHPRAIVEEGVREGECRALMQDFFRSRRPKKM
ncbi:MAG: nucleoside deaminase [Muribaculaceae bacterium]|nr:nucleoside deaminase [Muribaculaceae bacterium]